MHDLLSSKTFACAQALLLSCRFQGVEHLLSALEMLGVDNARIEVEGGTEIPIIDGSALGWTIDVQSVSKFPAQHALL
jgi:UDP-3-O-acyl-N-acetylglucosamine deacetylase